MFWLQLTWVSTNSNTLRAGGNLLLTRALVRHSSLGYMAATRDWPKEGLKCGWHALTDALQADLALLPAIVTESYRSFGSSADHQNTQRFHEL